MANDNARNDKDLSKEVALKAWRRMLMHERASAMEGIREAMKRLADANLFHPTELAKFYTQMLNGSAVPGDFHRGKDGFFTTA